LSYEVWHDVSFDTVTECADRSRHGHRGEARAIVVAKIGVVENDSGGDAKPTTAPARRQRQMNLPREHVGQVMERQGRLVREHARLLTPQPEDNEILVVTGRKMDKAIDAASNAFDSLTAQVGEQLRRVTRRSCLLSREVSSLTLRDGEIHRRGGG
jgi:hypothetical protein